MRKKYRLRKQRRFGLGAEVSYLRIAKGLSLPVEMVTQTAAILAKRGVGKTHTAVVITEELLAADQQVVILDPLDVWFGLRSSRDGKDPGFPITVLGGEHADFLSRLPAGRSSPTSQSRIAFRLS